GFFSCPDVFSIVARRKSFYGYSTGLLSRYFFDSWLRRTHSWEFSNKTEHKPLLGGRSVE
ncbi:hypothetical protein, partial [Stenotrophomonas sp. AS012628]|uniref:hypothetical protein n=1 Tax=Stenotrophomonas sp. AS012628 TaxID=2597656 RepID=UPI001CA801BF